MLKCPFFIKLLKDRDVNFFTGVPDSVFEPLCNYFETNFSAQEHMITVNEGNAIALATGYHLSTGKIPLVYFQNSGLGNAINPLTSLTSLNTGRIPILLIVGWRGAPGAVDEPQHTLMGRISESILTLLEIEYEILATDENKARTQVTRLTKSAMKSLAPVALLIRKDTFEPFQGPKSPSVYTLSREKAIGIILSQLAGQVVVSTTGKCSREVFEYQTNNKKSHKNIYYNTGAMGHTSMIALGISMFATAELVYCIDGDGALLMHMGSLVSIGTVRPKNMVHILLNNGAHDSVGGQRTGAFGVDIPSVARSCGYEHVYATENESEVVEALKRSHQHKGISFIEIKINCNSRKELARPSIAIDILVRDFKNQLRF